MTNNLTLTLQRPRGGVYTAMAKTPGIHLLFIGALACTRHRSFEMIELQKQGRLSFLCLDEVDFITGGYLSKIEQAILEIAEEKKPTGFLLTPGCQSALLSTDYQLLTQDLEKRLGIPIRVHEACHLCGLESETSSGKPDTIEQIIFDFLKPTGRSVEPTVNLICAQPVSPDCELFSLLQNAGVKRINEIDRCRSFEEYQLMAAAHLNIICSGDAHPLGKYLEEKLGIPYVVLNDIYDAEELSGTYAQIGEILGVTLDTAAYQDQLKARLEKILGNSDIDSLTIEGSVAIGKWLYQSGAPVRAIALNFRTSPDPTIVKWFQENAPEVSISRAAGHGGSKGSGRPEGFGSGRGGFDGGRGESGGHGRPEGCGGGPGGFDGGPGGFDGGRGGHGRPEAFGGGRGEFDGHGKPEGFGGRRSGFDGGRGEFGGHGRPEGFGGRPGSFGGGRGGHGRYDGFGGRPGSGRGGSGGHGGLNGFGGGRGSHGGRGFGSENLKMGFQAANSVLDELENTIRRANA